MGRTNTFIMIVVLLLTLAGGTILGALAGAGASVYLIQKRLSQPITVVSTNDTAEPKPTATTAAVIPTAIPVEQAPDAATAGGEDIPAMIERVRDAVVTVENYSNASELFMPTSTGSGAIISPDGYIVTNNHVIEGADTLRVLFADGTGHDATLIGADPLNDIAVLQVTDPIPTVMVLGNSDALRQGEPVIAIGSPLGSYRNTVTVGVVSALNRNVGNDAPEGLIQTDAAINNGNSGGPLLNARGEIIGINTLVVRGSSASMDSAQGLGFAVPSTIVRKIAEQLVKYGEVRYPFLGISYGMVTPDIVEAEKLNVKQGAFVSGVTDGGPAQAAGILPGDVILTLDGVRLGETDSLRGVLLRYNPGDSVTLTVLRGTEEIQFTITLAVRPSR
ncbi:MAG: PDZ domain-containing protein [Chloroflexi bacterium]|nr:MAG: PDZ domain-containing protein [Chloroflexota bacterium]RLT33864.1 MAG: PDZ domain-containing protein [Chloroflexota bacterium]